MTEKQLRLPCTKSRKCMLALLGAGGAAVVLLAVAYLYFCVLFPGMGSGPAGPDVPRKPFNRPWHEGRTVLLGLGDSITDGYGASPEMSYFDRLVKNPSDEFPEMRGLTLRQVLPRLDSRNVAVSGSTSLQCLEQQLPALKPYPADVLGIVVLTTGGNDLIHMYGRTPPREHAMYGATMEQAKPWVANYRTRLNTIIDRIEDIFPGGCHVFVANIYDPSDGVGDLSSMTPLPRWKDGVAILKAYNGVIERVAGERENVHLVDIHSAFLGHGLMCRRFWLQHYQPADPTCWCFHNIEDPNDRGYDAIRRVFLNRMADVFAPEDPASKSRPDSTPLAGPGQHPGRAVDDDAHGNQDRLTHGVGKVVSAEGAENELLDR